MRAKERGINQLFQLRRQDLRTCPISQNLTNTRTISQLVDVLKLLLGELEGFRHHVRDIFSDKPAGVNRRLDYPLHKERSEGLDSTTQKCRVERDVDAPEGNCGKAALEFDWLRLSFGLFRREKFLYMREL